jgi:hypothetical protein
MANPAQEKPAAGPTRPAPAKELAQVAPEPAQVAPEPAQPAPVPAPVQQAAPSKPPPSAAANPSIPEKVPAHHYRLEVTPQEFKKPLDGCLRRLRDVPFSHAKLTVWAGKLDLDRGGDLPGQYRDDFRRCAQDSLDLDKDIEISISRKKVF